MSLTFTFFNDDAILNEGAHVYVGDLKKEGSHLMAYRIKMKYKQFWLYDGTPKECGRRELLHGEYDIFKGVFGYSGAIRGYNTVCDFGPSGFFGRKLKFTDGHTGRKYKWKIDFMGFVWELKDPEGQVVATFVRSKLRLTKQGRLTIHQGRNIPEHLLALILVTQKLVHNLVRQRERQQSQ